MNKAKSGLTFTRIVYIILASIAVIGVLFITAKNFRNLNLSSKTEENMQANIENLQLASAGNESFLSTVRIVGDSEKTTNSNSENVTSRSSADLRTDKESTNNSKKELNDDSKNDTSVKTDKSKNQVIQRQRQQLKRKTIK